MVVGRARVDEAWLTALGQLCAASTPVDTSKLCMNDSNDAVAGPRACLSLGDARTLGRGGPADPIAAQGAYARGCAGGEGGQKQRRVWPDQGAVVARALTPGEAVARMREGPSPGWKQSSDSLRTPCARWRGDPGSLGR